MNIDKLQDLLNTTDYVSIFTSEPHIANQIVEQFFNQKFGIVSSTKESSAHIYHSIEDTVQQNVINIGTFEDAYRYLLEQDDLKESCDILLFNNCSYNPETSLHLSLFIKLWSTIPCQQKLIFVYRNMDDTPEDVVLNNNVLVIPSKRQNFVQYFTPNFNPADIMNKELLLQKINELKGYMPDREFVLIVPTTDYDQNYFGVQCLTEDIALNTDFSERVDSNDKESKKLVFIDTCLRNITYASVGGGIRFIDSLVGSDYLTSINSLLYQNVDSLLYRLIDQETFDSLRIRVAPFLTMYQNLTLHYNLPFKIKSNQDVLDSTNIAFTPYLGNIGTSLINDASIKTHDDTPVKTNKTTKTAANSKNNKADDTTTVKTLAALIDTLDHSCVEYPSSDVAENAVFFTKHFLKYIGNDSLEVFASIFNDSILYRQIDEFIDENHINFTMYMEFYNVVGSLHSDTTKTIGPKVILLVKTKLYKLLDHLKLTITNDTLYAYEATDAEGSTFIVLKNPLINDISINTTIYPLSKNENVIKTFII